MKSHIIMRRTNKNTYMYNTVKNDRQNNRQKLHRNTAITKEKQKVNNYNQDNIWKSEYINKLIDQLNQVKFKQFQLFED